MMSLKNYFESSYQKDDLLFHQIIQITKRAKLSIAFIKIYDVC